MRSSGIAAALLLMAIVVSSCAGPKVQPAAAPGKPAVEKVAPPQATQPAKEVQPARPKALASMPAATELGKAAPATKRAATSGATRPATGPATRPTSRRATKPASGPASGPASQPASRPALRQATEPAATEPASEPAEPPRLLISVGDVQIMSDRLDKVMRGAANLSPEEVKQRKKMLYKSWIEEELITAYLRKQQYPPEAIEAEEKEFATGLLRDQVINEIMSELSKNRENTGEQTKGPTQEEVEARVAELADSPDKVQEAIDGFKTRRNMDDEKFGMIMKYRVMRKLAATPEKVTAFIESHPVSFFDGTTITIKHILIAYGSWDSQEVRDQALAKLQKLAESIKSGEIEFEKAAELSSDSPSAKQQAIEGPLQLSGMVTEFAVPIEALKVGEMSEPIQTFFGWHLAKITERKDGDGKVGQDAQAIVKAMLMNQAHRTAITESAKEVPVRIYE